MSRIKLAKANCVETYGVAWSIFIESVRVKTLPRVFKGTIRYGRFTCAQKLTTWPA